MEFSSQINKFQTLGAYEYKFDEAENVIANSASIEFSYNYLSLPLLNSVYDNASIESYYDVNFVEFVPVKAEPIVSESETAAVESNTTLIEENALLKEKIDELISRSENDPSIAENEATKRVILDLRISLKQGRFDDDFAEEFPYSPLERN